MQKINLDIFSSFNKWNKNKNYTIFRNEKNLKIFQNYYLNLLLNNKKNYEPKILTTSGTSGNIPKKYKFPKILYEIIENHHVWKIMHFNKIEEGNVIKIYQAGTNQSSNFFEGPKKIAHLGLMNDSWELRYNPKVTDSFFWKKVFDFIKNKKPKFIYTFPSAFECFYEHINYTFDFPIIFSCETLTDVVRKKSDKFFSKSIDKMRDWTTGFGFFECDLGTKHVYDDLCVVKQIGENSIESIDLFNYCQLNPNKISDDRGLINKKLCDCGLYGNTIESFEGKYFEHLVSIRGKKYCSNYISSFLSSFDFEIPGYEVIQDKNKNIIFKTTKKLEDKQVLQIAKYLKPIIIDDEGELNLYNNNKTIWQSKKSNVYFSFKQDDFKIYKNKKISLRNFVI